MQVIHKGLSDELQRLFTEWYEEFLLNIEHEMDETKAWNALIFHLIELERKVDKKNDISI